MKYPKYNKIIGCDPDFINRYYDGEVSAEEHKSFGDHIKGCASCEKLLQEFRYVSDHYRAEINEAIPHTKFEAIRDGVLKRIKGKQALKITNLWESLFSKKFYIPIAAATMVVLVLFTVLNIMRTNPVPSAIVNSFSGQVSSVMILETPGTHHTIVWFSEESTTNGEVDAYQKT